MSRKLIIQLSEDAEENELIVERVSQLVSEGYTSGFQPWWEIKEEEPKQEFADLPPGL